MSFYQTLNAIFQEYYDQLKQDYIEIINIDEEIRKITVEDSLESYFFAGDFGCGKTKSAVQFARLWQRNLSRHSNYDDEFIDANPIFITLQDYIELNNNSINQIDLRPKIERIKSTKLLILDDISLAHWSESSINHLTQLIKFRHESRLQTIFTSNKGLKELKKEIPAVVSRIIQMCGTNNCLLFKNKDYRICKKGMKTQIQLELEASKLQDEQGIKEEPKTSQNES